MYAFNSSTAILLAIQFLYTCYPISHQQDWSTVFGFTFN
ncbi:hypothetical protein CP061683_2415 [Chlamydia psittaci 06-1683]|nr:hypothetical protein CP061683_2415 [Chlamydia psittaci 06-1683]